MKYTLIVVVGALLFACSSHPGWIHRAPAGRTENPSQAGSLLGVWDRSAYSRFNVASRVARSGGREWIAFHREGDGSIGYRKTHIYGEVAAGKELLRYYQEEGVVEYYGDLVLLAAKSARRGQEVWAADTDLETAWARLQGRGLPEKTSIKEVVPEPLLYFLRPPELIPFAYERSGQIFDFGIYEGTTEPFETSSPGFREAVRRYTEKQFHNHAYIRRD